LRPADALALPGLEPDHSGSDEEHLGAVAPVAAQLSGSYDSATAAPSALEAGLPTMNCSNVANALRDLLELAKRAGIDPAHPAMAAAAAEIEKLKTYIARQSSAEH
jgi:hypothetical protein